MPKSLSHAKGQSSLGKETKGSGILKHQFYRCNYHQHGNAQSTNMHLTDFSGTCQMCVNSRGPWCQGLLSLCPMGYPLANCSPASVWLGFQKVVADCPLLSAPQERGVGKWKYRLSAHFYSVLVHSQLPESE